LDTKSVSLPEEKHISLVGKLALASSKSSISAKDLHSLAGSLSHASTVVPEGRVNLHRIWSMLTAMSKSGGSTFRLWKWSRATSRDIVWWATFLSSSASRPALRVTTDNYRQLQGATGPAWTLCSSP
jgi:hypothetical protein